VVNGGTQEVSKYFPRWFVTLGLGDFGRKDKVHFRTDESMGCPDMPVALIGNLVWEVRYMIYKVGSGEKLLHLEKETLIVKKPFSFFFFFFFFSRCFPVLCTKYYGGRPLPKRGVPCIIYWLMSYVGPYLKKINQVFQKLVSEKNHLPRGQRVQSLDGAISIFLEPLRGHQPIFLENRLASQRWSRDVMSL